eukprot:9172487-Alexandrium_andersonii.AAC.1
MNTPKAGRSRGPNLGSATRLSPAHATLEEGAAEPLRPPPDSLSRIDGSLPCWRLIRASMLFFWTFLTLLTY